MLQFLPYALAAYGGYKGYKASKDAGGSGLQRLLAGATGAFLGYQGGKMVPGATGPGSGFTPFTQLGPVQSLGQTFPALNIPTAPVSNTALSSTLGSNVQSIDQAALSNSFFVPSAASANVNNVVNNVPGPDNRNILQKLFMREKRNKAGDILKTAQGTTAYEIDPLKAATGIGALSYFSGAFENKPQDVFTPTYNLAVAELQKQRGGFKYIDPVSGDEKTFEQLYIPEADPANQGKFRMGPYAIETNKLKEGGLAQIKKFNEGGINYLPSKVSHDENDANNYVRASGYVEDGAGVGDKDEDTMLAQLADGEFVTRADGVLGAGIIAGGNPSSMKDMREKGAQYFYEQQKRYKRVFDLLEGSRNAKAKAN